MNEDLRLEKLLNDSEIGDRKPSEFSHDLRALSISNSMINNDLLVKLWMRKLPPTVQMHLSASYLTSIDDKLVLADKIYDLVKKNQISAICTPASSSSSNQLWESLIQVTSNLAESVNKLSLDVSEIKSNNNNRTENNSVRSNYNSFRTNDNNSFRINDNNISRSNRRNLCWYHRKYGNRAQKCISPCDFIPNINTRNLN